jgi:hypothetical protein
VPVLVRVLQNLGIAYSGLVQTRPELEPVLIEAWSQYLQLEKENPDPRIVNMVKGSPFYRPPPAPATERDAKGGSAPKRKK